MKHNHTTVFNNSSQQQDTEPLATANFTRRERVRHRRLAGITIPMVMLFLLIMSLQAITNQNSALIIALLIGLGVCIAALFLNWRGLVRAAGILTLVAVYLVGTFTMLHYPDGLTASNLYLLDLTIIPDVLVLAFFSANSLLPIVCINAIQAWVILIYGPHDSTVNHLLQTPPLQILFHVYTLQLITGIALYLWVRSTERTLALANRAEERVVLERREKELRQQELEKKHQLDGGIQQILQTHRAVANGDLNARAPLHPDHDLWQVAGALNNLISRFQSQSHTIHELKQQIGVEKKRTTRSLYGTPQIIDQYPPSAQTTGQFPRYERTTGQHPKYEQTTGQHPRYDQTTGQFPRYDQTTGQHPKYEQTTGQFPRYEQTTGQYPRYEQTTGQYPRYEQN